MTTFYLDGRDYASADALHTALQHMMHLPAHYGKNADALHDCLSEQQAAPRLWIADLGSNETAQALRKVCAVVEDMGGETVFLG